MTTISIFETVKKSKDPHDITIEKTLLRIKNGASKVLVEKVRAATGKDLKELKDNRGKIKILLPCVTFAGTFKERNNQNLLIYSRHIVLDFDNVSNPIHRKEMMAKIPFIYACWISPSGDGLKVLVRVGSDNHAGHYFALAKVFSDIVLDKAADIARACYESYDPDIYINEDAVIFNEISDIPKEPKNDTPIKIESKGSGLVTALLNNIANAVSGTRHNTLRDTCRAAGGYIATGGINEYEFVSRCKELLLNNPIDGQDIDFKAMNDGISHGKNSPLYVREYEKQYRVKSTLSQKIQTSVVIDEEKIDFWIKEQDYLEYLEQWRTNTFAKALSTGIPSLDEFYMFKRGNFNVFNGLDNVGKSTTLWYFSLLSALYHDWHWVILSSENRGGSVLKRLIEFYWCEAIDKMSDTAYNIAFDFVMKHFSIVDNDKMYNFKDVLAMTDRALLDKKYDGVLIDPYNALKIDLAETSKLSTHEYHYEAASEMQLFAKQKDICVYLNCHVNTASSRLSANERKVPTKADTEGGVKFANKADDFITLHREPQDKENCFKTQIHVRKIKETETGGGYTEYEKPYILNAVRGTRGFQDDSGYNPIFEYHKSKQPTEQKINLSPSKLYWTPTEAEPF